MFEQFLSIFPLKICYLLEFLFSLAPEVSHQPLRGEGVLRRHPPAHHCVQESFTLACVKAQHLLMEILWIFLSNTGTAWTVEIIPEEESLADNHVFL